MRNNMPTDAPVVLLWAEETMEEQNGTCGRVCRFRGFMQVKWQRSDDCRCCVSRTLMNWSNLRPHWPATNNAWYWPHWHCAGRLLVFRSRCSAHTSLFCTLLSTYWGAAVGAGSCSRVPQARTFFQHPTLDGTIVSCRKGSRWIQNMVLVQQVRGQSSPKDQRTTRDAVTCDIIESRTCSCCSVFGSSTNVSQRQPLEPSAQRLPRLRRYMRRKPAQTLSCAKLRKPICICIDNGFRLQASRLIACISRLWLRYLWQSMWSQRFVEHIEGDRLIVDIGTCNIFIPGLWFWIWILFTNSYLFYIYTNTVHIHIETPLLLPKALLL